MIFSALSKYKNAGILVMRVGLGIAMTLHGYPKLMSGVHGWAELGAASHIVGGHFFPSFWGFLAALSEFLGGILIILGLAFRPACLFIAVVLGFALFLKIKGGSFSTYSESLELLFAFMGLFILGPGRFSVDKK